MRLRNGDISDAIPLDQFVSAFLLTLQKFFVVTAAVAPFERYNRLKVIKNKIKCDGTYAAIEMQQR